MKLSDGRTEVLTRDFTRIQKMKTSFEQTMAEARSWSDKDLWQVASDHFTHAARQARDIAKAIKLAESYAKKQPKKKEKKAKVEIRRDFEPMDVGFAMFNSHVNDAANKANAAFIEKFGQEAFDRVIKPLHDQGIMAIFNTAPTEHTEWYATKVQEIVNDGRPYVPASEKKN